MSRLCPAMSLRDDDRAVTVQIGAVLLFGILVISMATYQVTVVPDDNAAVEFRQSQQTQKQMQELRNAIVRSAASGTRKPASVTLGTTYPSRALFVNPPPATGTLRTAATGNPAVNLTIAGAVAADAEVRDYWDGSPHAFDTGFLVYEPDFNEYRNAPTTIYEHTVVANAFDSGRTLSLSGQSLVDGRRVNLVALNGSMRETGVGSTTVAVRPLSASSNTIAVRNDTSPIVISFATRLTNGTWRRLLSTENVSAGGHVTDVSFDQPAGLDYTIVRVSLEPGVTYELDASLVGVGATRGRSPNEMAAYVVGVDQFDDVSRGQNVTVGVRVLDRFNNPVSGATVNVSYDTENLTLLSSPPHRTGEDGRVSLTFNATNITNLATINVSIGSGGASPERVIFSGSVKQPDSGPLAGPSGVVRFNNATEDQSNHDLVHIYLDNVGSRNLTVQRARVAFYYVSSGDTYSHAHLSNATRGKTSDPLEIAGPFVELDQSIRLEKGTTTELLLEFHDVNTRDIQNADYFVVVLEFSNGETDTYYLQVR